MKKYTSSGNYTFEFIAGDFTAEYEKQKDGKYYLKKLLRVYTTELYSSYTHNRTSLLTEAFEWYAFSYSPDTDINLLPKFKSASGIYSLKYDYAADEWKKELPPYVFFEKDAVYKDLEIEFPIGVQFEKAGQ